MSLGFSIKLHRETQVSGHLGMSGGRSPRHVQNPLPCPITTTLTSSSVHHFISSIDYNLFIILQCHSKALILIIKTVEAKGLFPILSHHQCLG